MAWLRMSRETRKDLLEGTASLMLCNVGDYISGFFLQLSEPIIRSAHALLALLPAASDARGDVYSSYGSRLGTLLHLGLFKRHYRGELLALITLLIAVNLWVGLLVVVINDLLAGQKMNPIDIPFIALFSASLAALMMIPSTTWLAVTSFRRGLDPDNLVSPIATLFGDMVTIPTIIAGYLVAVNTPTEGKIAFIAASAAALLTVTAYLVLGARRGRQEMRRAVRIIKENLTVIMISTLLSALAGVVLVDNIQSILSWKGVLAVVPAFLEDGGAIACRFSSRLATMLHLGRVRLSRLPRDRWVLVQFGINMFHALLIFTSLGAFGAFISIASGGSIGEAAAVFTVVLAAGIVLAATVSLLTYYLAMASFILGIDPDNTLAPILTSIADILGTTSLAAMIILASGALLV
ncbi:MAG: hypothetical protein GXO09_06205 [Crenarchaeota archaeon]|nr:hypothetical protein [Thermoproteota archaeon]